MLTRPYQTMLHLCQPGFIKQRPGLMPHFLLLIMPPPIGRNLVLFEEENYLLTRYDLVSEVRTVQVFFLTL